MGISTWIKQLGNIVWLNLRGVPRRAKLNAVAILSFASVVLVMTGVLSMQQGLSAAFLNSDRRDVAVVIARDAEAESDSSFNQEQVDIIASSAGIALLDNKPDISREYLATLRIQHGGIISAIRARGMETAGLRLHQPIRIVAGRQFNPGVRELLVGKQALAMNPELAVGRQVRLGNSAWLIVGTFDAAGSVTESEVWTSVSSLQDAFRDFGSYNVVYAGLAGPAGIAELRASLADQARVPAKALMEADYLAAQSAQILTFIKVLGGVIATLMGLGAVIAAIITMYTAVAARTKELATMRCLGFYRSTLVAGLAVESMILGLVGGAIGSVVAYGMFNGLRAHTLVGSQVGFDFIVGWNLVLLGVLYAIVLGLLGGLIPSFRASRIVLATAIRE
jgi:putative ABC transport system permease protein